MGTYRYDELLPLPVAVFDATVHLVRMPIRWAVLHGILREV